MNPASRQFIVKILIFTLLIYAIATVLFHTVLTRWYFAPYPYLLLLVATITTIGHLWILKASAQNTRRFTTAYMASVTLKLIAYIAFMLIYLLIDRTQVITFVLTFITLYLTYTIFEVVNVLKFIRKPDKISL